MAQAPLARKTSRPQQLWQDYGSDLVIFWLCSCCLFLMFAYGKDRRTPGWRALPPTQAALLILAVGSRAWLNRAALAHPALVFVGLISYPLYLWHWPLLYLTRISAVTTTRASSSAH